MRYIAKFDATNADGFMRIMPVGAFERFGRKVEVTAGKLREMVDNFNQKIPDRTVGITLAHRDEAGKIGNVAELDAREDGLYARVDWFERGRELLAQKAFQFFSPEVVWGPTTFDHRQVSNLLVGLSLVNNPFFGKATALFSEDGDSAWTLEAPEGAEDNNVNNLDVQALGDVLAKRDENFLTRWFAGQKPERTSEPEPDARYAEAQAEIQRLSEQLAAREAAEKRAGLVAKFAELGDVANSLAAVASYDETLADAIAQAFRARATQEKLAEVITSEVGGGAGGDNASYEERLNSEIAKYMEAHPGASYADAMKAAAADLGEPEWVYANRK